MQVPQVQNAQMKAQNKPERLLPRIEITVISERRDVSPTIQDERWQVHLFRESSWSRVVSLEIRGWHDGLKFLKLLAKFSYPKMDGEQLPDKSDSIPRK